MLDSGLEDQVVEMIRRGKKIAAVKLVRERTGLGLGECKNLVEEVQASLKDRLDTHKGFRLGPSIPKEVVPEIEAMLCKGAHKKIDAIKLLREKTGYGLLDAKNAVEDLMEGRRPWPEMTYFLYREVVDLLAEADDNRSHLMPAPVGSAKNKAVQKLHDGMGVMRWEAEQLADLIWRGTYPCPPRPPKWRSIDDE